MSAARGIMAVALLLGATLSGGCASVPVPGPVAARAPTAGAPPGAAAGPRAAAPPPSRPATADSGPSDDARAVLATIPEPLAPSERVEPPARVVVGVENAAAGAGSAAGATTDSSAADSGAAPGAGPDSARGEVPVPEPTQPLGDRPGSPGIAIPDSVLRPRVAPAESAAARPDTCWRLQIVAPRDKPRAEQFRAAAASQLLVPFVVERETGLFKVRSRDCLPRATADALKRRALQSGFKGAFLMPVRAQ